MCHIAGARACTDHGRSPTKKRQTSVGGIWPWRRQVFSVHFAKAVPAPMRSRDLRALPRYARHMENCRAPVDMQGTGPRAGVSGAGGGGCEGGGGGAARLALGRPEAASKSEVQGSLRGLGPSGIVNVILRFQRHKDATRTLPGGYPEVTPTSLRGHRTSAHNFGELGAILTKVILRRGPSSEHNFGELGAILAKVMLA